MEKKSIIWLVVLTVVLVAVLIGGGTYLYLKDSEIKEVKDDIGDIKTSIEGIDKSIKEESKESTNIDTEEISIEEQDVVNDAIVNTEKDYAQYSNEKYGFSLEFPKSWGKVKIVNKDLGDLKNEHNLDTYYIEAENDSERYFYVSVNEPSIKVTSYTDAPRTYLGGSEDYIFYYASTIKPFGCDQLGVSQEYTDKCNRMESIYEDEIKKIIVPSFELTD